MFLLLLLNNFSFRNNSFSYFSFQKFLLNLKAFKFKDFKNLLGTIKQKFKEK